MHLARTILGLAAIAGASAAQAQGGDIQRNSSLEAGRFVTLGTMGGPIPDGRRSQPANVLVVGEDAYVIDAGDGVAEQLAKAGIRLPQIKAVILSHLHFDHTGGLFALLGLRLEANIRSKLQVYGPPGTKALVDGLIASMIPGAAVGDGDPNYRGPEPKDTVETIEIGDGASFQLGSVAVTARQNTHYSFAPGSDQDRQFKSLAFRFTLPGRSIVYTGDTGPSAAVEELAKGADLLVSEMIDVDDTAGTMRRTRPDISAKALERTTWHLSHHHLTPDQVGQLAGRAGVGEVVVTHLAAPSAKGSDMLRYLAQIHQKYAGPAVIANDLDEF